MQYIMLFLGTIFVAIWIFIYIKYNKEFDNIINPIGKNEFFMSDLFFIGFGIMRLIKYNLKSSRVKQKTKKIAEVRGDIYADYYYFVITGGKFTYLITFLPVSFFIGAIASDILIFFIAILTIGVLVYYLDFEIKSAISKRREDLLNDFPRALSKLALLLNAGMTLRASWNNVSTSGEGILYTEMKRASEEISNGMNEAEAYKGFAERCAIKEIRKFASSLTQNLQKGNTELKAN